MKTDYQIVDRNDNTRQLAAFLAENGQVLMPMVELIESARMSVDQLMTHLGRATLEAVLQISAAGVAERAIRGRQAGMSCATDGNRASSPSKTARCTSSAPGYANAREAQARRSEFRP